MFLWNLYLYPHYLKIIKDIFFALIGVNRMIMEKASISIGLFLTTYILIYFLTRGISQQSKTKIILSSIFILIFLTFGINSALNYYGQNKYKWYLGNSQGKAWWYLEKNFKEGINIAYSGTNVIYGLFGSKLKNNVFYVSLNSDYKWGFHDYDNAEKKKNGYMMPPHDKPQYFRTNPNFKLWVKNLRNTQTDILYVTKLYGMEKFLMWQDKEGFPIERKWADENPKLFRIIYADDFVKIYKLLK